MKGTWFCFTGLKYFRASYCRTYLRLIAGPLLQKKVDYQNLYMQKFLQYNKKTICFLLVLSDVFCFLRSILELDVTAIYMIYCLSYSNILFIIHNTVMKKKNYINYVNYDKSSTVNRTYVNFSVLVYKLRAARFDFLTCSETYFALKHSTIARAVWSINFCANPNRLRIKRELWKCYKLQALTSWHNQFPL